MEQKYTKIKTLKHNCYIYDNLLSVIDHSSNWMTNIYKHWSHVCSNNIHAVI
jgi:hypothetical protein